MELLEKEAEYCSSLWRVLFTFEFWQIYLISCFEVFYGYFMMISYKSYGMWEIHDDNFLASAGAFGLLSNGILRLIWPSLMEKYTFKYVNSFLLLVQISLIIALPYALRVKYWFFIVICLSFICEGGISSMLPTYSLKKFGNRKG